MRMSFRGTVFTAVVVAMFAAVSACGRPATTSPPVFASLVDDYLEQFSRHHPSIAAGNGLHAHDELLEDLSAGAVAAEVAWLHRVRAQLDAIDPAPLTPDERVDRRILQGVVDGWVLDLDAVKTWTRNPM